MKTYSAAVLLGLALLIATVAFLQYNRQKQRSNQTNNYLAQAAQTTNKKSTDHNNFMQHPTATLKNIKTNDTVSTTKKKHYIPSNA
ncbi:hypothetical protein BOX15_Mlig016747g2, partial [Macrostomum lignano]